MKIRKKATVRSIEKYTEEKRTFRDFAVEAELFNLSQKETAMEYHGVYQPEDEIDYKYIQLLKKYASTHQDYYLKQDPYNDEPALFATKIYRVYTISVNYSYHHSLFIEEITIEDNQLFIKVGDTFIVQFNSKSPRTILSIKSKNNNSFFNKRRSKNNGSK